MGNPLAGKGICYKNDNRSGLSLVRLFILRDCEMQQSSVSNVEIGSQNLRRVYRITYSQEDVSKFPTRQSFEDAVLAALAETNVMHWCCWKEHHQKSGVHYHMSVKLSKCQRWLPAKKFLADGFGIPVHFSSTHANYYTAWKYVTKDDDCAEESKDHPDCSRQRSRPWERTNVSRSFWVFVTNIACLLSHCPAIDFHSSQEKRAGHMAWWVPIN